MTYTTKKIATYVDQNINLIPNSNWTIYDGPNGLTHTRQSKEYRDPDYKKVFSFFTMDEPPKSLESIINSIEFQKYYQ
jgi:hypothetical protein